jgi:hypothetical protein
MHVQARGAQVRRANFAYEIADGISHRLLSLYGGACYPTSVMRSPALKYRDQDNGYVS